METTCGVCSQTVTGAYELRADGSAICPECHAREERARAEAAAGKYGNQRLARFGGVSGEADDVVGLNWRGQVVTTRRGATKILITVAVCFAVVFGLGAALITCLQ